MHERLRTALAALRVASTAAPRAFTGLLAATLVCGALPVAGAFAAKLLLDELARGRAADATRATALVLIAVVVAALTDAAHQLAWYAGAALRRATALEVEARLTAQVASFDGLAHLEDPRFQDRLQLAGQAALQAPQDVTTFALQLAEGAVRIGG